MYDEKHTSAPAMPASISFANSCDGACTQTNTLSSAFKTLCKEKHGEHQQLNCEQTTTISRTIPGNTATDLALLLLMLLILPHCEECRRTCKSLARLKYLLHKGDIQGSERHTSKHFVAELGLMRLFINLLVLQGTSYLLIVSAQFFDWKTWSS